MAQLMEVLAAAEAAGNKGTKAMIRRIISATLVAAYYEENEPGVRAASIPATSTE